MEFSSRKKSETNVKIEEATEKWKGHAKRIKKKKKEEILYLQENKFNLEEENDAKNRKRTLKYLKKDVARKSDSRHLANSVGKGKKNGLRKVEVEVGDDMATVRNKEEIERMIMKHNK